MAVAEVFLTFFAASSSFISSSVLDVYLCLIIRFNKQTLTNSTRKFLETFRPFFPLKQGCVASQNQETCEQRLHCEQRMK